MKIKKLINILQQYPEDADVIFEYNFIYDVFEYVPTGFSELLNDRLYIEMEEL